MQDMASLEGYGKQGLYATGSPADDAYGSCRSNGGGGGISQEQVLALEVLGALVIDAVLEIREDSSFLCQGDRGFF